MMSISGRSVIKTTVGLLALGFATLRASSA
jgi:hypothetical protein